MVHPEKQPTISQNGNELPETINGKRECDRIIFKTIPTRSKTSKKGYLPVKCVMCDIKSHTSCFYEMKTKEEVAFRDGVFESISKEKHLQKISAFIEQISSDRQQKQVLNEAEVDFIGTLDLNSNKNSMSQLVEATLNKMQIESLASTQEIKNSQNLPNDLQETLVLNQNEKPISSSIGIQTYCYRVATSFFEKGTQTLGEHFPIPLHEKESKIYVELDQLIQAKKCKRRRKKRKNNKGQTPNAIRSGSNSDGCDNHPSREYDNKRAKNLSPNQSKGNKGDMIGQQSNNGHRNHKDQQQIKFRKCNLGHN